jgi:uncharacterized delta-60 repeat protein
VVTRPLVAIALLAATLTLAGAASGEERPGTFEGRIATFSAAKIWKVVVTSDGRIVAAGVDRSSDGWIRAYLPDGSPDRAFGQDGTVDLGPRSPEVIAMVAQPDGRVIMAQEDAAGYPAAGPARLTRLTRDGSPDSSFGTGGSVDPAFGSTHGNWLTDLVLQPEGGIVVVGARGAGDNSPPDFLQVDRYLQDGSPDTSFGAGGRSEVSANSLDYRGAKAAVQPNGAIVLRVLGGFNQPPMLARLSADGRLDDNFGRGGLASIELANPQFADDVEGGGAGPLVLPDGRIRVPAQFERRFGPNYRMALVGLTSNGHPDRRFGDRGLALAPVPTLGTTDAIDATVRDSSGSIIVAGSALNTEDSPYSSEAAIIRRFRPNGSIDRSFGSGGLFHDPRGFEYGISKQTVAMLDEDTLVVGNYTFDGRYGTWGPATVVLLNAGHDRARPSISLRTLACRSVVVRIRDLSRMDRVVVRAGDRVVRRTTRKRFRVHVRRGGRRIEVRATDLAGNSSSRSLHLPRC